jgi:uncharacterized phage infection (PIP) family protein YhgE
LNLQKNCNELLGDKLNTLLDTVYSLNDASDGVSDDLEKLISSTVKQVEDMIDENDKLMESWK